MVVLSFTSPRRLYGFGVALVVGPGGFALGAPSTGTFSRCHGGIIRMFRAIFLAVAVELRGRARSLCCCCLSVIVRKARVHLGESLHRLSCRWWW